MLCDFPSVNRAVDFNKLQASAERVVLVGYLWQVAKRGSVFGNWLVLVIAHKKTPPLKEASGGQIDGGRVAVMAAGRLQRNRKIY